jgi:hypothetical protein
MYLSLPVAAFDVNHNRATAESAARYFRDAAELAEMMECVPPADGESLRAVMKKVADRRYLRSIIADKYAALVNA